MPMRPSRAKLRKLLALVAGPASYRRALGHGVAAGVEHHVPLRLAAARTVVDVGANKGQFYLAARRVLPAARIYSFEPLASARARLERIASGDRAATIHPYALSDRTGAATMTVTARRDSSSLLAPTERQVAMFPGTRAIGEEEVDCRTLDEMLSADELSPLSLLKIDVQGGELAVLEGGTHIVPRFDWVYVECSYVELYAGQPLFAEVAAHLERQGFALYGRFNLVHDDHGGELQADCLFRRAPT